MTIGKNILLIACIGFIAFLPVSSKSQAKSVPTVLGWRLPVPSDMKEQWSEKYWTEECRKAEEAAKKAVNDAIEETGVTLPTNPTNESTGQKAECWTPDFPVHVGIGDYNGDGIQDEAWILISTTKHRAVGIFAFLKTKTKKVNIVRIKTITDSNPQNYFTGTIQPGERIDTACGKGYWDCGPAEPKAITLRRDAVIFGQFESWSAVAYWDSRQNKFKVVALSD